MQPIVAANILFEIQGLRTGRKERVLKEVEGLCNKNLVPD